MNSYKWISLGLVVIFTSCATSEPRSPVRLEKAMVSEDGASAVLELSKDDGVKLLNSLEGHPPGRITIGDQSFLASNLGLAEMLNRDSPITLPLSIQESFTELERDAGLQAKIQLYSSSGESITAEAYCQALLHPPIAVPISAERGKDPEIIVLGIEVRDRRVHKFEGGTIVLQNAAQNPTKKVTYVIPKDHVAIDEMNNGDSFATVRLKKGSWLPARGDRVWVLLRMNYKGHRSNSEETDLAVTDIDDLLSPR